LAHAGHRRDGRAGIEVRGAGKVAGDPGPTGSDRHGVGRIFSLAADPGAPEDAAVLPEPRQDTVRFAGALQGGSSLRAYRGFFLEAAGYPDLAAGLHGHAPRVVLLRTPDPLRPLRRSREVELRHEAIGLAGAGEMARTRFQGALEGAGHVDAPGVHRHVDAGVDLGTAQAAGPDELA